MPSQTPAASVVGQVVARHLCSGCGTCVAVCPTGALEMRETPAGYLWATNNPAKVCKGCGLCLRVCPGAGLSTITQACLNGLDPQATGSWAWAHDRKVRRGGMSGGIVSAMLCEALSQRLIEAALVTRWDPRNPTRPCACIVRSPSEILEAQKSKYCMVPVGAQLRRGAGGRLAVVGLPCHMYGISRLLEHWHEAGPVVRIALFCDRVLSYHVIDRLLARMHLRADEVESFEYRHKGATGWPGDVFAKPWGAAERFLHRSQRTMLKEQFTPVRCRLCVDKCGVFADVACGDGYGAPQSADGISALLVRTEVGRAFVEQVAPALETISVSTPTLLAHQQLERRARNAAVAIVAYNRLCPSWELTMPAGLKANAESIAKVRARLKSDLHFEQVADPDSALHLAAQRATAARRLRLFSRLLTVWARVIGALLRRFRTYRPMTEA